MSEEVLGGESECGQELKNKEKSRERGKERMGPRKGREVKHS